MAYEDITDRSNPFATTGLSKEVLAILGFLQAAKAATGIDVVATSTTDHPERSNSGRVSRHVQAGTDGKGLGVDCRLRARGTGRNHHRAVFDLFVPVEAQLHELIYADAPYNIRAGKRVRPYAVSDHRDHVHLSVNRGVFLRYPQPRQEVRPMYDPPLFLAPGVGIVASLAHPFAGLGATCLLSDGGTWDFGPPHCGNVVNKRYFAGRRPARLLVNPQWEASGRPHAGNPDLPWYVIQATSGETYGLTGFAE